MGYGNTWIWGVFSLVCGFLCLPPSLDMHVQGLEWLEWLEWLVELCPTMRHDDVGSGAGHCLIQSFHFHFLLDYTRPHIP